jgi:hypothetical protein
MSSTEDRLRMLEAEIERRLAERFAALKDEFERLRLESDRRWAGFISRFDQDFTGIVPAELVEPRGAAPAGPGTAGASVAVEDLRSIDEASGQVEILNRYLELCRRGVTRAALLITKGSRLTVWRGLGFSPHGGGEERLRQVSLDASSGDLARALGGTPMRLSPGHPLFLELETTDAVRAVLVPMVVKEKVSGVLYADSTPADDATFQPERLAALTFLAGLAVDRLSSRKLRPSPPLSFFEDASSSARRPSVPSFVAEAEPEELPRPPAAPAAAPPPAIEALDYSDDSEPSAPRARWSPEPPPPAPPPATPPPPPAPPRLSSAAASPAATVRMDAIQLDGGIAGEAAASAPPTPLEPSRPSTGVRRLAGPLAPPEGNERHEEAKRFARLLVSEIKLYNERAVQEGREHNDIYPRLKEDIDRSRQMYDERIPEDVRAATNFFHEELVRTLADGREEALGGGH